MPKPLQCVHFLILISSASLVAQTHVAQPAANRGDTSFLDGIGGPGVVIEVIGDGAHEGTARVPSLAPQAIVGALLIVAMSTGYVLADRLLSRNPSPSATVSVSRSANAEQGANGQIVDYGLPADPDPELDIILATKIEDLQLIIADLLYANQKLRTSGSLHSSKDNGSANSRTDLLN
jgi:XapX domain-containing protein